MSDQNSHEPTPDLDLDLDGLARPLTPEDKTKAIVMLLRQRRLDEPTIAFATGVAAKAEAFLFERLEAALPSHLFDGNCVTFAISLTEEASGTIAKNAVVVALARHDGDTVESLGQPYAESFLGDAKNMDWRQNILSRAYDAIIRGRHLLPKGA